jgi:hypothetical protein
VQPGLLRLSILVSGTPVEFPPLGDGDLVTCQFGVLPGVPAGTAALEFDAAFLFAGLDEINVGERNGFVTVVDEFPTPTPTLTGTPEDTATATATDTPEATATATDTPEGTATVTNTPVNTATATNTPVNTATATNTPPNTPTHTNTPPSTSTVTATNTRRPSDSDDGCSVVPVAGGSGAATGLLLLPALLLWARRRV